MQTPRFLNLLCALAFSISLLSCGSSSRDPATAGASGASGSSGASGQSSELRLRARGEAVINGVEAELRGSFERRPDRTRLDGELEDIDFPVGSLISFCLGQGDRVIPLAVGIVRVEERRKEAEFHIRTDDGQKPPDVKIGDVLRAHDGANGNVADCSKPLLVSGAFVSDNSADSNSGNNSAGSAGGGSGGGSSDSSGSGSGGGSGSSNSGSGSGDEFRLRARGEAMISGVEAELRADFRKRPDRTRLDGELEDINLPSGTPVTFCLVQDGNTVPLAVGNVHLEDQRMVAELSIRTDDGEQPPEVMAGNVLEARNGASGGAADCGKPLLVRGTFVPDN